MRIVPLNIRMALDLRRAWNFGPHSGSPLLSPPHGSILSQIASATGSNIVRKTLDQTITNTYTNVADTELLFPVVSGGIYTVQAYINFIDETYMGLGGVYNGMGGAMSSNTQLASSYTLIQGPLGYYWNLQQTFKFTANANGNVWLSFHSNAGSTGDLVCLAGSYLIWTRIG